ncbi:MAG: hypothetical protein JJ895_04550 [Balneolaceae bacterium]|nr:hypothetical protein [Balneolaceae bacterium]
MEKRERSRIGLSFLTGLAGAYFLSDSLTNMGYYFGLDEITSATNARYLMNILAGIITGVATVFIPQKSSQLRALVFVVGSLILMDTVAYLSTSMPISDMINRFLVSTSIAVTGGLTIALQKMISSKSKT